MIIWIPRPKDVILANKFITSTQGNPFAVLDEGKIESALHSAFYLGVYPFVAGGIGKTAGALCFYLLKAHAFMDGNKRTAATTAINFMKLNGWNLRYPYKKDNGINAFANVVDRCASNKVSKDELIEWFERHKIRI